MSTNLFRVFVALFAFMITASALGAERPNIVLFLVDDMGWQDTSVPFHTATTELNRRYRTPNMDRLAASGMKFTQAYACSVCSPTRVSLMTGLNAARHRVTNWTLKKNASNDRGHATLAFPKWNVNGLSPVAGIERTVHAKALPAYLREAGYRTIHVGKAHFGAIGTPGADPTNVGFDVNIAGHAAGGPGSFLGTQNFSAAWRRGGAVWDVPGLGKYHGKPIFLTEALTIEANSAVDQAVEDQKPFFLYMSHYAVHVPFAKDDRFYQKYRDAAQQLGDLDRLGRDVFARDPGEVGGDDEFDPGFKPVSLFRLVETMATVMSRLEPEPQHEVETDSITIGDRVRVILAAGARLGSPFPFIAVLADVKSRKEVVMTFVAILELARTRVLRVVQGPDREDESGSQPGEIELVLTGSPVPEGLFDDITSADPPQRNDAEA